MWRNKKNMVIYKSSREGSEAANPGDNLLSDFQPPELWENKFLLFKPLSLGYFVIVALAN